jgi:molecular chaperone DnaJ
VAKEYYNILEVGEDASQDEIKKSYKRLVKKYHPDKGGDEEKFKKIAEAYETLSNPEKKGLYDNPPDPLGGLFNMGGQGHMTAKGGNVRITLDLTLEDVFNGVNKTLKYNRDVKCEPCHGKGGSDMITCDLCRGRGFRIRRIHTPLGYIQEPYVCNGCNGTRTRPKTKCGTCHGKGTTKESSTVDLEIPSGIAEDNSLTVTNYGNAIRGGQNGDLLVRVSIKEDGYFVRDGFNLLHYLELTYPQLVLGCDVEVKTIEGTKIKFKVEEFSKSGHVARIPKKGLKHLGGPLRGDLFIEYKIVFPESISDEEKELLEKLRDKVEIPNNS